MTRTPLDPETYLANLTPAQREAVLHLDGPLLIVAGPGSGKTRVITCRVAHLIAQGVRPYHILAITFTNKAANEMRQRVAALLPNAGVWISTFHSFGVRLLRQYGERLELDRNFTIYDQADRVRMVKAALDAANIDNNRFTPETIQGAISKAKNQLLTPDKFAGTAKDYFSQVVAKVYPLYEKKMRAANALDFDDLLLWPALALKNDQEFRAEVDARFRYVLIDEYQDTNKAQYAIARGLSVDHPNLCVVGDPDQSIYKWRGADIKNILDFENDFPDAKVITLSENFRSTKTILAAADSVIVHNRQRKPKPLHTANAAGGPVRVLQFENGVEEAEQIVKRIRAAVQSGQRRYLDFAIFMRINALTRMLESAFIRQKVPFQIVRGLAFFERKENKDILAYLRLLLNPRDDVSFERIVNEPARGIGKTSLEHLTSYAEPRGLSLLAAAAEVDKIPAIKGKAATGLKSFVILIQELQKFLSATPDEVIRQVLDRTGYRKMLKASGEEEDQERLANIEELITAARQFHEEDNSRTLADFLENITLASDVDGWDDKQDCVAVMTLHAAKGLEFPVVYMVACEQGLLPHERSLANDADIEEERRLAFVGLTRAKEELNVTHVKLREFRGQINYTVPSMFLSELPHEGVAHEDLSESSNRYRAADYWRKETSAASKEWFDAGLDLATLKRQKERDGDGPGKSYREGMTVEHEKYGRGKITEVSGHGALRKIKIRFTGGERAFIAEKAKLTIVGKI
ncbi:MAG: UvrD-helicase domain-containing protein [Gemmataceae bacterium]|nr:UvrD-helicase domain-containing protein [Gemmataceae bacterium]MCI0740883.1 UvrD-helicase domain-containing protein [Gemmataceae bacterium]